MQIWKDIEGYKGHYQISNYGNDRYEVTDWACGIVDGVNIKEDTWYRLEDGKLVECE